MSNQEKTGSVRLTTQKKDKQNESATQKTKMMNNTDPIKNRGGGGG
jgi:hypothetical protein